MNEFSNNHDQMAIRKSSGLYIVLGWICAIISLFILPFIFGVVGVVMGILTTKNGSKAGLPIIIVNIGAIAVGLMFSGVFLNYLTHYLGI